MKGNALLKYLYNVFEKALPETDLDREYFDILEQSDKLDTNGTEYPETTYGRSANGATFSSESDPGDQANSGYIHTIRGVKISFADINHISNKGTHPRSREFTPADRSNTLDLRAYTPAIPATLPEETPPHILDTRS